jgi:hypothetical protein
MRSHTEYVTLMANGFGVIGLTIPNAYKYYPMYV